MNHSLVERGNPGKPEDRNAFAPSDTIQRKDREDFARLNKEEEAREKKRSMRDPADLARLFVTQFLPLQVFINHLDALENVDSYDEAWLRGLPFLKDSPYLNPIVDKVNAEEFTKRNLSEQKDALLPWRPNVMQVFYPYIVSIVLDSKRWISSRNKSGNDANFFISMYEYGEWLKRWIGNDYEEIAQKMINFEKLVGKRKQFGQHVQDYERDLNVTPEMRARALWAGMEIVDENDVEQIYSVGRERVMSDLRPWSILSKPEYKFLYSVGNLVVAFLGNNYIEVGSELPPEQMDKLVKSCLD